MVALKLVGILSTRLVVLPITTLKEEVIMSAKSINTQVAELISFEDCTSERDRIVLWSRGTHLIKAMSKAVNAGISGVVYTKALDVQRNSGETDGTILGTLMNQWGTDHMEFLASDECPSDARVDSVKVNMGTSNAFANAVRVAIASFSYGGVFGEGPGELPTISKAKAFNKDQKVLEEKADVDRKLEAAIHKELVAKGMDMGSPEYEEARTKRLVALTGGKTASNDDQVDDTTPAFIKAEVKKLQDVLMAMHLEANVPEHEVIRMVDGQIDLWRKGVANMLLNAGVNSGFILVEDVKATA